jgi:DNA-binding beta-propeller fold protein YncE
VSLVNKVATAVFDFLFINQGDGLISKINWWTCKALFFLSCLFTVNSAAGSLTWGTMLSSVSVVNWIGEDSSLIRSPFKVVYSPDGRFLAVSDATAGCCYVIEMSTKKLVHQIALQGSPRGVCWRGSDTVYVAEYDNGTIAECCVSKAKVVRRMSVGPKPIDVSFIPASNRLLVSEYGLQKVYVVDLIRGTIEHTLAGGKQPYLTAVSGDGKRALVGNLIPAGPAMDTLAAATIQRIDVAAAKNLGSIVLPDGSTNVRSIAISADGRWGYVVHTRGRTSLITNQLDRGWLNTNVLTIIDMAGGCVYASLLLDDPALGAADPWGVALSTDGRWLWVSAAGTHELIRIQLDEVHALLAGQSSALTTALLGSDDVYAGTAYTLYKQVRDEPLYRLQLVNFLNALSGTPYIERFASGVQGPRSLALSPDGKTLAVGGYFSGVVALVSVSDPNHGTMVSLGKQPSLSMARRGEMVFHDAQACFQNWLSCVSCHPEGRADGLNWDLLNDGMGNPKNAKSLLLSPRTPPSMSLGVRESYEVAVASGFRYIQFFEPGQQRIDEVKSYLTSMEPERSPYLVKKSDGTLALSPEAQRGKELFFSDKLRCAKCHTPPLYTDLKSYDVGTTNLFDQGAKLFDTPTLIECWRTGPYLHDGSAVELEDAVRAVGGQGVKQLGDEDVSALIEYIRTL